MVFPYSMVQAACQPKCCEGIVHVHPHTVLTYVAMYTYMLCFASVLTSFFGFTYFFIKVLVCKRCTTPPISFCKRQI